MVETLPADIEPYPGISSKAYEHPADRAATAALKTVPMLDTVVRKLIEWQYERAMRQMFLSNAVRVGERQLPDLWGHHQAVCKILQQPQVGLPELFARLESPILYGSSSQRSPRYNVVAPRYD